MTSCGIIEILLDVSIHYTTHALIFVQYYMYICYIYMFVTAKLVRNGRVVSDNILFKHEYIVATDHHDLVGNKVYVIAGPHKDFDEDDVYTVELLNPPIGCSLPFFNSKYNSLWEHVKICIE